jgi:hypothetical protein
VSSYGHSKDEEEKNMNKNVPNDQFYFYAVGYAMIQKKYNSPEKITIRIDPQ